MYVTNHGGGAFRIEYWTVNIDTSQLADTLTTFIATPFTIRMPTRRPAFEEHNTETRRAQSMEIDEINARRSQ